MKQIETRIIWGLLLILGGLAFLLDSLNVLPLDNVWPIIFALPGLIFVAVFLVDRDSWWAAIPGFTLLGLAALIAYVQIARETPGNWEAIFILGGIALGFLAVYVRTGLREWWAIIPGGVMTSIIFTVALEPYLSGDAIGGIFMMGLALTFGLVYLVPTSSGRMKWAIIPAGILGFIGLLSLLAATTLINYVWPLALIVLGGYLIYKSLSLKREE